MKKFMLPKRAVSCALAASLALTLNPAAAFATNDDSLVNVFSTQSNEPMVFASEGANTPSNLLNLTPPTVNVTAPLKVGFDNSTSGGLDMNPDGPQTASCDVKFINNGSDTVYMTSVTCESLAIEDIFEKDTNSTEAVNPLDKEDLLSMKNKENKAVNLVVNGKNTSSPTATPVVTKDHGFTIVGHDYATPLDCKFIINTKGLKLKSGYKPDNGVQSHPIATCVYTFAAIHPTAPTYNQFFFKDNKTDIVYNINQIKTDANSISDGNTTLEAKYQDYITKDVEYGYDNMEAGKESYVCRTNWGDGYTYDIRILDTNKDPIATSSADATPTAKNAGLTMQFRDCLMKMERVADGKLGKFDGETGADIDWGPFSTGWDQNQIRAKMNENGNSGTWTKEYNVVSFHVRQSMNDLVMIYGSAKYVDDDSIWNCIPTDIKNNLEYVSKKINYRGCHFVGPIVNNYRDANWGVTYSSDKLFLLSLGEVTGNSVDNNEGHRVKSGQSLSGELLTADTIPHAPIIDDQYTYFVKTDASIKNSGEVKRNHSVWVSRTPQVYMNCIEIFGTASPDDHNSYGHNEDYHGISPAFCL